MKLNKNFLPICKKDMELNGINQLDFIFITGDAYVDHPSFGTAIISRILEREGFTVGIIAQPNWKSTKDFRKLGRPKLAFLINSGNMDSMVNHYTASRKRRHEDLYSPGGKPEYRPDRALIVYCNRAREAYRDVPIIIGGIEASLRRFAHYDYWSNKIRRSILMDSKSDILVYGMGEKSIVQIANLLKYGMDIHNITDIRGTVYSSRDKVRLREYVEVPSFQKVLKDKKSYGDSFRLEYLE